MTERREEKSIPIKKSSSEPLLCISRVSAFNSADTQPEIPTKMTARNNEWNTKKSIIICTAVFTVIVTVIFSLAINAMVVKKNILESDKVVTVCVKIGKINSREFEGHITESNDIFNAGDRISIQYKIIQKALVDNLEESQVGNTVEVSIAKTEFKSNPNNVKALEVSA